MSAFLPIPYGFHYCSFIVQFEVRAFDVSSLFFPPEFLWLFRVFCGSIEIGGFFWSVAVENAIWIWMEIVLNLYIALGQQFSAGVLMRTLASSVRDVVDATNKFTWTAEVLWRKGTARPLSE